MKRAIGFLLGFMLAGATIASAQGTDEIFPLRVVLGAVGTQCTFSTKAGVPSGGSSCDVAVDATNQDLYINVGGTWKKITSYGTVTSVGLSLPSVFSVTGSPVTTSGTLTASWVSPGSNSLLCSASGTPAFCSSPTITAWTTTGGGTLGTDILPSSGYFSNLGSLTDKFLTLHAAELWVETLVAQKTLSTVGGRFMVGTTNELSQDATAGATTLHFKYNNLSNGDRILFQANGAVEIMAVTSAASGSAGNYTYTVTRNLDGTGADAWSAGSAAFDTCQAGCGWLDMYSVVGTKSDIAGNTNEAGPTIVGNIRNSSTYNDWSPMFALGRLDGTYGYTATSCTGSTPCYGFAAGDNSKSWVKIDPTNGLRMGNGANTKVSITPAGTATFVGDGNGVTNINGGNIQTGTITATQIAAATITGTQIAASTITAGKLSVSTLDAISATVGSVTVGTGGYVRQGQTAFNTGTGWWIGDVGGVPKFSMGNGSTYSLYWDGSSLVLNAGLVALTDGSSFGGGGDDLMGANIRMNSGKVVYPGSISGLTAYQSSYYLASHASFGLYTNTNIAVGGRIYFEANANVFIDNDTADRMELASAGHALGWDGTQFYPFDNHSKNLGVSSSFVWANIYADTVNYTVLNSVSDARKKDNIADDGSASAFLLALRPVTYEWKEPTLKAALAKTPRQHGFLAQDVAKIDPTWGGLHYGDDGVADGLNYNDFVSLLVKGFQEHDARIADLEKRIAVLEAKAKGNGGGQ